MPSLLDNPDFITDLRNESLSGIQVARKWGCAESTARAHRIKLNAKDGRPTSEKVDALSRAELIESREVDANGNIIITKRADRIIPLTEWLDGLRAEGLDPDDYQTSHSHSVYMQHTAAGDTKTLYANKFSVTKLAKKADSFNSKAILESVRETVENYTPPEVGYTDPRKASFVICAADWQMGKVDINGDSTDTAEQILNSFARAADNIRRFLPEEVVIIDAGDIIENLWNVPSQRSTNDLGLPHQVEAAVRLMLAGIKMLAPLTPRLRYVAVPSNHGRSRVGYKQEAGDAHDDYGIAIAKIVRTALALNDAFTHVEVVLPEPHLESVAIETCGTRLGVVHGHQASRPEGLTDWWRGQALGNGPVADARVLIAGHFHSLRMQTVGDDRTLFVCPSSDRGSSWYTNLKGESSRSGMLTFLTMDNEWGALEVL